MAVGDFSCFMPAGTVPLPYGGTVDAQVGRSLRLTLRPGERLRLRYRVAVHQDAPRGPRRPCLEPPGA